MMYCHETQEGVTATIYKFCIPVTWFDRVRCLLLFLFFCTISLFLTYYLHETLPRVAAEASQMVQATQIM